MNWGVQFDSWTMGLMDGLNYVLFKNPVSSTVIDTTKYAGNTIWQYSGGMVKHSSSIPPPPPPIPEHLLKLSVHRIVYTGTPYIRLAGFSGVLAVMIGAYGAHSKLMKSDSEERKRIFETANRYHFMHTLALLAVPLSRHPKTVSTVMSLGMILFCGTCYYDAFTGDTTYRKYTPVGGSLLVLGWVCFML